MTPNEAIITATIYLLGLATVLLSLTVAVAFLKQRNRVKGGEAKELSTALAWQLCGEAAIGAGTLAFAFAAHTGALDDWSTLRSSALRFSMFAATSLTTAHLYLTIKRIS